MNHSIVLSSPPHESSWKREVIWQMKITHIIRNYLGQVILCCPRLTSDLREMGSQVFNFKQGFWLLTLLSIGRLFWATY